LPARKKRKFFFVKCHKFAVSLFLRRRATQIIRAHLPNAMQPEAVTAIVGGAVTLIVAAARVIARYARSRRGKKRAWARVAEVQTELTARRMPDARAHADACAACARAVERSAGRNSAREEHDDPIAAVYDAVLRGAPQARLPELVRATLPLYYAAVYHATAHGGSAAVDTFRASARRLHLPDAVCVLARVGHAHVPVRIEPRAGLRPLVEHVALEEQLCADHAEENALALATVRDWTSNERPALAVTVHPAYATALTMHLLRADEGACVVCVARDADRAVGAVLRALYKNEATFVLRVDGLGHVSAVCAVAHAAEHVADVHHADVGALLGDGAWRGRACSATTIAVHAERFIFVVLG
jgi:hypothetical protein